MSRTILRTPEFAADLRAVYDYLDEHSRRAAERLSTRLAKRLRLLTLHPRVGRDRDEFVPGLRSIVVDRYVVFFTFTESLLILIRFLHGSRDLPGVFGVAEPSG